MSGDIYKTYSLACIHKGKMIKMIEKPGNEDNFNKLCKEAIDEYEINGDTYGTEIVCK